MDLPPYARAVLLGPDLMARALAARETDPERRWLLRRPRAVRRSFVTHVIDDGEDEQRWMLLQDDATRLSYVEAVEPDLETAWLLRQTRRIRDSYIADVLDG